MSELQDILRVQARLHRKQGAIALGNLFENASKEIKKLTKHLEKANERIEELEEFYAELEIHTEYLRNQVCWFEQE